MSESKASEIEAANISANSAKHAAWVAAGVSVVTAIIAFIGSRTSADVGAHAALDAAKTQVAGETDRSRAEFLRLQQQTLYSRIIAHHEQIEPVADHLMVMALKPSVNLRKVRQLRLQYLNLLDKKVDPDWAAAQIIASDRALKMFRLYNNVLYHEAAIVGGTAARVTGQEGTYTDPQLVMSLSRSQSYNRFIDAARADMGN